jgi:ribonucleoside-diphosphate reductase beta chain
MAVEVRQLGDDQLEERVGGAKLQAMDQVYIDDVLAYTERGLDSLPSYMDLYRRAIKQAWNPDELDFSADRREWDSLSPETKQRRVAGLRLFFDGEERVASILAPFVWAAPTKEIEAFAATQLTDEVRHTVFFERYWREVIGTSATDLGTLIDEVRPTEIPAYRQVFYDWLPGVAQRLASDPKDLNGTVEFVTLYHLVVEGALFLTGMRYLLEGARRWNRTWAFYKGFTATTRDESRHVLFGVRFLRDMVAQDPARFVPVVRGTIDRAMPLIEGHIKPAGAPISLYGGKHLEVAWPGYTPERMQKEMLEYARMILARRLHAAGLAIAA